MPIIYLICLKHTETANSAQDAEGYREHWKNNNDRWQRERYGKYHSVIAIFNRIFKLYDFLISHNTTHRTLYFSTLSPRPHHMWKCVAIGLHLNGVIIPSFWRFKALVKNLNYSLNTVGMQHMLVMLYKNKYMQDWCL